MVRAWPDAPVYTALYDEAAVGDLVPKERVRTSFVARMPAANRLFRYYAPFYPRAFESFDLRGYDAILSSTSAWAKGVRFRAGATHVCFIHTVSRFLFDYQRYVGALRQVQGDKVPGFITRAVVDRLCRWDLEAATRPTRYVANSKLVASRVREYYGREASVLHSPIEIDRFSVGRGSGDYFFIASRLLPYKRVDLAIDAARLAGVKLLVAGGGPAESALRARARGTTTQMLGFVPDADVNALLGDAIAVILPGEEDLGLVPLEAAATGRPTIAYRGGGALETVIEGETGCFFDAANAESLAAVLRNFDPSGYDAARLRAHAQRFAPDRFIAGLRAQLEEAQR